MIFINYKTYEQSSGEKSYDLARIICRVADTSGIEIISCPQAIDIKEVVKISNHPVWTQHLDPLPRGRSTGWLPAEVAYEIGVKGTLLNHSEHKLTLSELENSVKRCKELGLKTLVFADSLQEIKIVSSLKPDWVGYEPPELIGSTTTSVTKAKPEIIAEGFEIAKLNSVPLIVGAGVHSKEDVIVSLKLGAVGVALATDVVKAQDPEKELRELALAFK